jgi:signal transduction histidine kinase
MSAALAPSTTLSPRPLDDDRYVEAMKRLANRTNLGALAIHGLTAVVVAATIPSRLWVLALFFALIPFNVLVSARLLPKYGPVVAEVVRSVTNVAVGVWGYSLLGWPVPVWLWLPYCALAHEAFHPRLQLGTLLLTAGVTSAAGLLAGVPWIYPATFVVLAFICRALAEGRLAIIRDMLRRSDEQRRALDEAHAALKTALEARDRAELECRRAQKLEAIGRLAAGVAHEVNTPLQYAMSGLEFLREAIPEAAAGSSEELKRDVGDALALTMDGLDRVSRIVRALKQWAHPEQSTRVVTDLNRAVETTLMVAGHEYKYVAEVQTDFSELPPVVCHAGEIGQAVLNLVVNAAHAISGVVTGSERKGVIGVRTHAEQDWVVVTISDTGCGIDPMHRDKVFEPFFTTKSASEGIGQGLAIVHSIVVDRHGGKVSFDSEPGVGTTFRLYLPRAAS